MTAARTLRWVSGALEVLLAIPVLGGLIVMGTSYSVLGIMLILHIVTLVLSAKEKGPLYGSVVGIVTSVIAWIPIIGWVMHLISGILLMITAAQKSEEQPDQNYRF